MGGLCSVGAVLRRVGPTLKDAGAEHGLLNDGASSSGLKGAPAGGPQPDALHASATHGQAHACGQAGSGAQVHAAPGAAVADDAAASAAVAATSAAASPDARTATAASLGGSPHEVSLGALS